MTDHIYFLRMDNQYLQIKFKDFIEFIAWNQSRKKYRLCLKKISPMQYLVNSIGHMSFSCFSNIHSIFKCLIMLIFHIMLLQPLDSILVLHSQKWTFWYFESLKKAKIAKCGKINGAQKIKKQININWIDLIHKCFRNWIIHYAINHITDKIFYLFHEFF